MVYEKNASVPDVHEGCLNSSTSLRKSSQVELVPSLAQTPILEKAARRISDWSTTDSGPSSCSVVLPEKSSLCLLAAARCALMRGGQSSRVTALIFGRLSEEKLNTLAEESFRTILRVPVTGDTAEEAPEDDEEEEDQAPRKAAPRPTKRPRAKASGSEAGASGEASAKKPKTTKPPPLDSRKAERARLRMLSTAGQRTRPIIPGAPNPNVTATRTTSQEPITKYMKKSPAVGPSTPVPPRTKALHYELHKNIALQRRVTLNQAENIRTLKDENAELTKQLADAQGGGTKEGAGQQLAEKNSEHIREKGELLLKKNADSETIKRQQKELNGLRKYMETAEHHWDLLNENILAAWIPEQRRICSHGMTFFNSQRDDCKDLISASRKICYNLSIKRSRTCNVRKLVGKMDVLPELVTDLQASSARGAAAMALTMCLAHNPDLDLDQVTTGVPPDADVNALLDAVSGYDTRIARRIRHEEFYDKVVLPADEPLEEELQKSSREGATRGIRDPIYLDQLQGRSPRRTQDQHCSLKKRK
ncbi:hypothetical protein QYE76_057415 [Lolium multiflorum]|uniref:Uncharacterized protein n=1 Tax=Lolium multiflorum TaxID=4521 RepID=A0AAD8T3G0_LOLMU|nr:hypothetical protein QYE76_057415 [Lolium multiflorum]